MKTTTLTKWYCIVVAITAIGATAIGIGAYQSADFAKDVGRVPTWIGAFFGAIVAVSGAYVISRNKDEEEIKQKRKNIARIIGYETTHHIQIILSYFYFAEKHISNIKDNEEEAHNSEIAKMVIDISEKAIISDINDFFRMEISIFENDALSALVDFFKKQKQISETIRRDKEISDLLLIQVSGEFHLNEISEYVYSYLELIETLKIYCNDFGSIVTDLHLNYGKELRAVELYRAGIT